MNKTIIPVHKRGTKHRADTREAVRKLLKIVHQHTDQIAALERANELRNKLGPKIIDLGMREG
jgi:hypothetical protein